MKAKGAITGKNARAFLERAEKKEYTDQVKYFLIPEIKPNKSMKVADFCTGSGNIIPFFQNKVKEFVAIDASPEMINILGERYGKVKNLKIILSDVSSVPLESNRFGVVISKFSFHHIPNLNPVLKEAHRILKKNGRLFVIDLVFEGSWLDRIKIPFLKILMAFQHGSHELFCKYRDDRQINALFINNNFKLLKKIRIDTYWKLKCFSDYMYVLGKG